MIWLHKTKAYTLLAYHEHDQYTYKPQVIIDLWYFLVQRLYPYIDCQ